MSDIIFILEPHCGYYVNQAKATTVNRGNYRRLEFDLAESEIAALEQEDPETKVWGDEADLVFSTPDRLESWKVVQVPATNPPWLYWCKVDEDQKVIEFW